MARHGESTWNVEGRYQGRQNPPLTKLGLAQASALAERLVGAGIAAVVSSPLRRARDTARVCADRLGLGLTTDERLIEICHGEWEGKLPSEIIALWPEMMAAWRATPEIVQFVSGECLQDVQSRLESFLASAPHGRQPLLVITHDVLVRLTVLAAEHKPLSAMRDVRIDNASLNEFVLKNGGVRAIRINDTEHLGALRSDTVKQAL